jgi:hypothetical protein
MEIFQRFFWLISVGVICLNGLIWWKRGSVARQKDPKLEEGYRSLIRAFLIYGNIPWLMMGAGIHFGGVPSVEHFFNPRNGVFVALFWAAVIVLEACTLYWLFFRNGAEELLRHPGILHPSLREPWQIKLVLFVSFAGTFLAMLMMTLLDMQDRS